MAERILCVGGVYAIRNTINNKVYVGSAVDFHIRWSAHVNELNGKRHHNSKLSMAWQKYSETCFVFEILEPVTDASLLINCEQKWLDKLQSYRLGYNMCPTAGNCLGRRFSDATRKKMAESAKRRPPMSAETRARLSAISRNASLASRAAGTAKRTGSKRNAQTRQKMSMAQTGKRHSAETKAKLAVLAATMPTEQREKIAAALRGRKGKRHTPESIAKMSEAKRIGWQRRKAIAATSS